MRAMTLATITCKTPEDAADLSEKLNSNSTITQQRCHPSRDYGFMHVAGLEFERCGNRIEVSATAADTAESPYPSAVNMSDLKYINSVVAPFEGAELKVGPARV